MRSISSPFQSGISFSFCLTFSAFIHRLPRFVHWMNTIHAGKDFLKTEASMYKASIIRLTEEEKNCWKYLFTKKEKEIQRLLENFPSKNFLLVKMKIFSSPLFAVFKKMPKGGGIARSPGSNWWFSLADSICNLSSGLLSLYRTR